MKKLRAYFKFPGEFLAFISQDLFVRILGFLTTSIKAESSLSTKDPFFFIKFIIFKRAGVFIVLISFFAPLILYFVILYSIASTNLKLIYLIYSVLTFWFAPNFRAIAEIKNAIKK